MPDFREDSFRILAAVLAFNEMLRLSMWKVCFYLKIRNYRLSSVKSKSRVFYDSESAWMLALNWDKQIIAHFLEMTTRVLLFHHIDSSFND
jgi:hypothetical protein